MFVWGKVMGWRHFPSPSPTTRRAIEFGAYIFGNVPPPLPPSTPTLPIVKSEAKLIYEPFSHETWQPRLALHFGNNICVKDIVAWERSWPVFFSPNLVMLLNWWSSMRYLSSNSYAQRPIAARAVLYQRSYILYTPPNLVIFKIWK